MNVQCTFFVSDHAAQRMQERLACDVSTKLPEVGAYLRLVTVRDTVRKKELAVIKIKGGVFLAVRHEKEIVLMTVLSNAMFDRDQSSRLSRFQPIMSQCVQVAGVQTIQPRRLRRLYNKAGL